MGLYVNPGNEAFRQAVADELYIDKTNLISRINQKLNKSRTKHLCVSRPRRFGKSMAADMLTAYYSKGCKSEELFAEKKIAQEPSYKQHLNQYHVIRLDIQQFLFQKSHFDIFIGKIQKVVIRELEAEFGSVFDVDSYGLPDVLRQIYAQTKQGFIFIIDEWDCVFRFAKDRQDVQKTYLDFLRGLFKGAQYVELAYMTGILPIKKYGEHSAINIFDEYSMVDPRELGEYFGFTEEEVARQCEKHSVDYTEMKKWYDGYQLDNCLIYNPKSVIDALTWKEFQSYWTGTETYEALKIYIDLNFDGLKEAIIEMLGNGRCKINTRKFQNDMTTLKTRDDVLTLLIHLGYLTYDKKASTVYIPNQEIAQEFMNAVEGPGWEGVIRALERSENLLKSTWAMDGKAVADEIEAIHQETTSILKYSDENALKCTILMAYFSAKAYYLPPNLELPSGKGFADIVYLPRQSIEHPALLIELKWNKSAQGAINQIKNKQYTDWIKEYTGDILLVGIDYNEEKGHSCVIEKYQN
ncbi:MAG: AAA family ATPase [Lachnospiraceae bacterium]|nr:AAA family ATPase [Lachnospiraceae bacterium]